MPSEKETPAGNPVPPELEPVVKQIRSAFAYKNFRLLDTLVLRTRAGQPASVSGVVNAGASPGMSELQNQVRHTQRRRKARRWCA